MTVRTILAAVSGGAATAGTLDLACQTALRFAAHLEGFHVLPDRATVLAATGAGIGGPGTAAVVDSLMQAAAMKAAAARAAFQGIAAHHGLAQAGLSRPAPLPSATWSEETGDAAAIVARRGRFFDLIVLGTSDRVAHEPHTDTIEETLLGCGRPVLLAPFAPPARVGYVVAAAWNGSPQAARALAAALPFLEKASAVTLITAGDGDAAGGAQAVEYLAWHGIAATHRTIAATSGRQVGRVLIDAAREAGADLLVMGAYGHAPLREQLFGGATRAVLAVAPMPLLLMH